VLKKINDKNSLMEGVWGLSKVQRKKVIDDFKHPERGFIEVEEGSGNFLSHRHSRMKGNYK